MKKIFLTCFVAVSCFYNAQVTQFLCENFTSYFLEGDLYAGTNTCYPKVWTENSSFPAANGSSVTVPPYSTFTVESYGALASMNPLINIWGVQFSSGGAPASFGSGTGPLMPGGLISLNTDWIAFDFVTRDTNYLYYCEFPMGIDPTGTCGPGIYVSHTCPTNTTAEWYTIGNYTIVSVFLI